MSAKDQLKPTFQWEDPLNLETLLSEEEKMIRDAANRYAQDRLQLGIIAANRNGSFDRKIMNEMGELGLLGSFIEGYGCSGVGQISYGLVAREIERVDSSYRSALSVQSSLVMYPIWQFGTEEQKQKYLPKLATGEFVGCFGLTEPDGGSDPGAMKTRARKIEGGFKVSGEKQWITNSPISDIFVVWAKNDDDKIIGLILEKDMLFGKCMA